MIKVHREPNSDGPLEHCCFCLQITAYWTEDKQIAVCPQCAERTEPQDIPTKAEWFRREYIVTGKRN